MKIQLVNDLHLDVGGHPKNLTGRGADVLVVAGDLCNGMKTIGVGWIEDMCKCYAHVVFVPGNHDYYHWEMPEVDNLWRIIADRIENFHYLNGGYEFIEGVPFYGCALWTDLEAANPMERTAIVTGLADFGVIHGMTPVVYQALHNQHLAGLKVFLDNYEHDCVVVTHHAPHYNSVAEWYREGGFAQLNHGFYTDLGDVFYDHPQIKLWLHGHTHSGFDYVVHNTRVVCNPLGYGKENPWFQEDCIMEI